VYDARDQGEDTLVAHENPMPRGFAAWHRSC
jgi:hypothetical protein